MLVLANTEHGFSCFYDLCSFLTALLVYLVLVGCWLCSLVMNGMCNPSGAIISLSPNCDNLVRIGTNTSHPIIQPGNIEQPSYGTLLHQEIAGKQNYRQNMGYQLLCVCLECVVILAGWIIWRSRNDRLLNIWKA